MISLCCLGSGCFGLFMQYHSSVSINRTNPRPICWMCGCVLLRSTERAVFFKERIKKHMLLASQSLLKWSPSLEIQEFKTLWILPCKKFSKLIWPINMSSGLRNLRWLCPYLPISLCVTPHLAIDHMPNSIWNYASNNFPRRMKITVIVTHSTLWWNVVNLHMLFLLDPP